MSSIRRVEKDWGYELWIHNDEKYCGKLLHFNKGQNCSFHYHMIKHETFYLQSGKLKCRFVPLEDLENAHKYEWVVLSPGDSKEIHPNLVHQMLAIEESDLFEFSTQHFDDDSYRITRGLE